jgi:small redox-active disulfide protein 2
MSAIQIEVLGIGCKKCQQLEDNAKTAVAALNLTAEIVHITDPVAIAQRGVMSTPALRINNRLVAKGKVLSPAEIQEHLQG